MYSRYVYIACKTPRIPLEAARGRMRMLQPKSPFTSSRSTYIYIYVTVKSDLRPFARYRKYEGKIYILVLGPKILNSLTNQGILVPRLTTYF